jgi:molecular chaperone GrpE
VTDPRDVRPDEGEPHGPVIRDKRRLDPVTGEVREPAGTAAPAPAGTPAPAPAGGLDGAHGAPLGDPAAEDDTARQLAERTADLQRLQAEYSNYRRRVDRDREVVRDTAVANVPANLLPVLDDIGRAREHGELDGAFKSVGEGLEQMVERLGLQRYGEAGEPFDPTIHEALTHAHSADVTEPTCVEVFQPGYRFGDRVVRPARVAVADPEQ